MQEPYLICRTHEVQKYCNLEERRGQGPESRTQGPQEWTPSLIFYPTEGCASGTLILVLEKVQPTPCLNILYMSSPWYLKPVLQNKDLVYSKSSDFCNIKDQSHRILLQTADTSLPPAKPHQCAVTGLSVVWHCLSKIVVFKKMASFVLLEILSWLKHIIYAFTLKRREKKKTLKSERGWDSESNAQS